MGCSMSKAKLALWMLILSTLFSGVIWDFAYILLLFRKKKEIYNNKKRECTGNTYFIFYSWICYYTVFFIELGCCKYY